MFDSLAGLSAAFAYGSVSSAMAFLNKFLFSSYSFHHPVFLLFSQMFLAVIAVECVRICRLVCLSPYSLSRARVVWKASLFCWLHSLLALMALDGMNIPMYAAIKRCTPAVNLILSVFYLGKPIPSLSIVCSIILITVGCIVAGFGDLSFDAFAYTMAAISVFVQGVYQTLIQKVSEESFSVLEIFHLNSYNCLFCFLVVGLFRALYENNFSIPVPSDSNAALLFAVIISLGVFLNYALFLSTSLNSALTTSLVGVLKSIFQTVVGYFTFGGIVFHPLNVSGIILNLCGAILYSYGKLREKSSIKIQQKELV